MEGGERCHYETSESSQSSTGKYNPLNCVLTHVSPQKVNDAADQQKNDPKSRWERGVFLAGRLMDGDALSDGQTIDVEKDQKGPPPVYTQELAEQHWLELVDGYSIFTMER
jgi:hypothetical protein